MNLSILLEQPSKKLALFGSADKHLRMIRESLGVTVMNRDDDAPVPVPDVLVADPADPTLPLITEIVPSFGASSCVLATFFWAVA